MQLSGCSFEAFPNTHPEGQHSREGCEDRGVRGARSRGAAGRAGAPGSGRAGTGKKADQGPFGTAAPGTARRQRLHTGPRGALRAGGLRPRPGTQTSAVRATPGPAELRSSGAPGGRGGQGPARPGRGWAGRGSDPARPPEPEPELPAGAQVGAAAGTAGRPSRVAVAPPCREWSPAPRARRGCPGAAEVRAGQGWGGGRRGGCGRAGSAALPVLQRPGSPRAHTSRVRGLEPLHPGPGAAGCGTALPGHSVGIPPTREPVPSRCGMWWWHSSAGSGPGCCIGVCEGAHLG